jgi:hypothetical protein
VFINKKVYQYNVRVELLGGKPCRGSDCFNQGVFKIVRLKYRFSKWNIFEMKTDVTNVETCDRCTGNAIF